MRSVNKGPSIQVKEEHNIAYYAPECCGETIINQHNGVEYPANRCTDHNKNYMKWKRIKKTKRKFKKLFNYKRHRFIKMLTFGLPGNKITNNQVIGKKKTKIGTEYNRRDSGGKGSAASMGYGITKTETFEYSDINQSQMDHEYWRDELRIRFAKLRREKFWKNHVDGGIWFYETVLTELDPKIQKTFDGQEHEMNDVRIKIHPHFHCIILSPKNLAGQERNFQELNALFEKHGLGKPSVTTSKDKTGKKRNASINKSLWYLTNYLKKQDHAEGKNRGSFGIFHKK